MTEVGYRYPLLAVVGAAVFAAAPLVTILAVRVITAPSDDSVTTLTLAGDEEPPPVAPQRPLTFEITCDMLADSMGALQQQASAAPSPAFAMDPSRLGLLVSELREHSLLAYLGLENGDIITALNGEQVASPSALQTLALGWRDLRSLSVDVVRDGRHMRITHALPSCPVPTASFTLNAGAPCTTPLHVPDDLMEVATAARIVPAYANGSSIGFKLYSIRPGSLYARLGVENGDVVKRINGYELNTPDKALEMYAMLKDAKHYVIELTRRGQRMQIDIDVDCGTPRVTQIIDGTFGVEELNMHELAQKARIAPAFADGRLQGVRLVAVDEDSFFARAGLRAGDVVQRVGDVDITSASQALEAYTRAKAGGVVGVAFLREGVPATLTYSFTAPPSPEDGGDVVP